MLVHVGIPVLDGKPHCATVDSLLADSLLGYQEGIYFYVDWLPYCGLIGHARNRLANRFMMMGKSDVFICIDADMSWKAGELIRLAKRPEPVIGGTYRAKTEDVSFHVKAPVKKADQLFEVGGLPGGFLKIARHAFEQMDVPRYDARGVAFSDYFPTGIIDGEYFGEDYGFCHQWRKTGGTIWLDPSFELRHHDGARTFTGNPSMWLQNQIDKANRRVNGETLAYVADMIRWRAETKETYDEAIELVGNVTHGAPRGVLKGLVRLAREADGPILEAGSGLSTILMAAATSQTIWCLEEDREHAAHLKALARAAGVNNIALVRCPIVDGWYDLGDDLEAMPKAFSLGFVDGPEATLSRMEWFEVFGGKTDVIVVDDAKEYKSALADWAVANDRTIDNMDRAVVLRRKG